MKLKNAASHSPYKCLRVFSKTKDLGIRVTDDGMSLEISVVWISVLTDSVLLRNSRIDSDSKFISNHLWSILFRSFLRRWRASNEEKIISRCTIFKMHYFDSLQS